MEAPSGTRYGFSLLTQSHHRGTDRHHAASESPRCQLRVDVGAGEVIPDYLIYVIQVEWVQLLRLSLDRYGNGGQTTITVLTHLGRRRGPGGGGLAARNLRWLVLLVARPAGVRWATGLQAGQLSGPRRQRRGGAVGTERWPAPRGAATA